MEEFPSIRLILADGHLISIDSRMKDLSGLLANVLEDSSLDEELPLTQVKIEPFREIIAYAEHHNYIEPEPIRCPIPTPNIKDAVKDPWDGDFISKFDDDSLAELTNTADYLDFRSLLDLCCGAVAARFKGKDVATLRAEYNVVEDFTAEEEERIKEMFPWILETDENQLLAAHRKSKV